MSSTSTLSSPSSSSISEVRAASSACAASPALVRQRDRVVIELEPMARRVVQPILAANEGGRLAEREAFGKELVHHLVADRQVRDRRGDLSVRIEADLALHERVPVDAQ